MKKLQYFAAVFALLACLFASAAKAQAPSTQCVTSAIAGGTANALTVPELACSSTTNLLILTAQAANTSTVTLQVGSGAVLPVLKWLNQPLAAGDIAGAGYRAVLTPTGLSWILLNPVSVGTQSLPSVVTPADAACSDAPVVLAAATSGQLLAATANIKSLTIMNIGTNPMTFVEGGGPAIVGSGMALTGASVAGAQGGAYDYPAPPTNAIQGISTLGTTVIVKSCL